MSDMDELRQRVEAYLRENPGFNLTLDIAEALDANPFHVAEIVRQLGRERRGLVVGKDQVERGERGAPHN
jgi:hypothetical protein